MIRAIEIEEKEFLALDKSITEILKKLPINEPIEGEPLEITFTSDTYQGKGLPTTNGKVLLLEPKQKRFLTAIEPLKIEFQNYDEIILKIEP